jgi:hypothetical protein
MKKTKKPKIKAKKAMIEFINATFARFEDAKNHGRGNNWWYPLPNVIAYNVKMSSFGDVESFRKHLKEVQNDYYNDNALNEHIAYLLNDEAEMLKNDVIELNPLVEDAFYAGRSGGWLEVAYIVHFERVSEDDDLETIKDYYSLAQKLEDAETSVAEFIKKSHKSLNNYVGTPDYYTDLANELLTDEAIITSLEEQAHEKLEHIKILKSKCKSEGCKSEGIKKDNIYINI